MAKKLTIVGPEKNYQELIEVLKNLGYKILEESNMEKKAQEPEKPKIGPKGEITDEVVAYYRQKAEDFISKMRNATPTDLETGKKGVFAGFDMFEGELRPYYRTPAGEEFFVPLGFDLNED